MLTLVISALMGQSEATTSSSNATGGTSSNGGTGGTSSGSTSNSSVPDSYNPSHGISGSEIDQMLAHACGTGAEIDYSAWDRAVSNFAATDATQNSNTSSSSNSQSSTKSA